MGNPLLQGHMKSQRVTEKQSGSTHRRRKKKQVLLHAPLKFFVFRAVCVKLWAAKCCWQPAVWAVAPWTVVVFCGRQPSDSIVSDCAGELERWQISVCFTDEQPKGGKASLFIFQREQWGHWFSTACVSSLGLRSIKNGVARGLSYPRS